MTGVEPANEPANEPVRVLLASGARATVPTRLLDRFVGLDAAGNLVVYLFPDDDPLYLIPLTPCCQADGKGAIDSSTGIVCRRCHSEVPAYFGGSCEVIDPRKDR